MAIWIPLLQLTIALVVLWKVCDIMIEGLSHIAHRFHIPYVSAGAMLGIMRASVPEFGVCLFAFSITEGGIFADVGLATVLGCILFNISLLLGICLLQNDRVCPPNASAGWLLLLSTTLLLCSLADGKITWWEASIGLVLFVCYVSHRCYRSAAEPHQQATDPYHQLPPWLALLYVFGSLAITGIASHFLVEATVKLSYVTHVSPVLLTLLVLSVGVSLPDLFVTLAAMRRDNAVLAMSQVFGSSLVNMLVCLGIPTLIHNSRWPVYQIAATPHALAVFEKSLLMLSVCYLSVALLVAILLLQYGCFLKKARAIILIGIYVAYDAAICLAYIYRDASWWPTVASWFNF